MTTQSSSMLTKLQPIEEEERSAALVFPSDHKVFLAKKTMRVPVRELATAVEEKKSIEYWLLDPNESLSVVFDRNEKVTERTWKVFVASKKKIAFWELSPAFTLEILPNEREFGRQAFRGFDLLLCADEDSEECEWANDLSVYANIFCELRVERAAAPSDDEENDDDDAINDTDDEEIKTKKKKYVTPIVIADVNVTIAAKLPRIVNRIPGFAAIGEAAIAGSIDFAREGASKRVQEAYNAWAKRVS